MNKDLMITQQDLIDWIDRPPSNDDLNLATFISTRLEKFYDLEQQLQQKENIINEFDKWLENEIKFQEIVENAHFLRKARIKLQELKGVIKSE